MVKQNSRNTHTQARYKHYEQNTEHKAQKNDSQREALQRQQVRTGAVQQTQGETQMSRPATGSNCQNWDDGGIKSLPLRQETRRMGSANPRRNLLGNEFPSKCS